MIYPLISLYINIVSADKCMVPYSEKYIPRVIGANRRDRQSNVYKKNYRSLYCRRI